VKREITLYAAVSVGGAGAVTLQKWNYPTLGAGPNARTYTAAPTANSLPSGNAYPLQYAAGAEGVRSVTRTATGLLTFQFQDNYQRCLQVEVNTQSAGGLSTVVAVGINTTLVDMAAAGGSKVAVALASSTATAADAASGDVLLFKFTFADATEP
jgi:hypothetical protein